MRYITSLYILCFTFSLHASEPVDWRLKDWKEEATQRFQLDASYLTQQGIVDQETWDKFRTLQLELAPVFNSFKEFQDDVEKLIANLTEFRANTQNLLVKSEKAALDIFPDPQSHPSRLNRDHPLPNDMSAYEKEMVQCVLGRARIKLDTRTFAVLFYHYRPSIVDSEKTRRVKLQIPVHQRYVAAHGDALTPLMQVEKILRLNSVLGPVIADIFENLINPLSLKRVEGPYVEDCTDVLGFWARSSALITKACKLFQVFEFELPLWFYNSFDTCSGISRQDYCALDAYWAYEAIAKNAGGYLVEFKKSGIVMELIRDIYFKSLTVVANRLYKMGMTPDDLTELLDPRVKRPLNNVSWLNMLSFAFGYNLQRFDVYKRGIYEFPQPQRVRQALVALIDHYLHESVTTQMADIKTRLGKYAVKPQQGQGGENLFALPKVHAELPLLAPEEVTHEFLLSLNERLYVLSEMMISLTENINSILEKATAEEREDFYFWGYIQSRANYLYGCEAMLADSTYASMDDDRDEFAENQKAYAKFYNMLEPYIPLLTAYKNELACLYQRINER